MFKKIIFLVLVNCSWLWAQAPLQLSFRHLTQQQGLPSSHCSLLFKDSRQFWWIGTQSGGLVRFDGQTCKHYPSFQGSQVINILEDKDGNLWVGSIKGLNFYDRRTDQFQLVSIPLIQKYPDCWLKPVYIDHQGFIWLMIACDWGLYVFDPKTKTCRLVYNQFGELVNLFPNTPYQQPRYLMTNASEGFVFTTVHNDKLGPIRHYFDGKRGFPLAEIQGRYFPESDSLIWLGADIGLIAFNPQQETFRLYNHSNNRSIRNVSHVTVLNPQYLLIGTGEDGLWLFDRQKHAFTQQFKSHPTEPNGLSGNDIDKILVDNQRNLLVSVLGHGIDYTNLDQIRLPYYLPKAEAFGQGLTSNHVTCALQRRDGSLWLGTKHDGVQRIDAQGQLMPGKAMGMAAHTSIKYLFEDSQKRLWIAAKDGLHMQDGKRKQTLLSNEGVNHLYELTPTTFFVSTLRNVYVMQAKGGRWALQAIKQVINGGHRYNQFVWRHPVSKRLYLSSESGTMWCELLEKGGEWQLGKPSWFPTMVIDTPYQITGDTLWFCAADGIIKWHEQTTQSWFDDRVSGKQLTKILIDNAGKEWYVSEKEVFSWDKKTRKRESFGLADGLSTTFFETNACVKLQDGRLLLGGTNGFNLVNPLRIAPHLSKGAILLTGVQFNDKTILFGEGKIPPVGYNENTVSFDFVAQDFTLPDGTVLEYQLENYDSDWLPSPAKGFVRYAKLPAGQYVFKVRFVGERKARLSIPLVVEAPIWLTWWFRALLVLTIMGVVYVMYRSSLKEERQRSEIKRMRAEAEMKAFRAQMNPHFVFNCMNTIDGYILSNRPEQASFFLQKFSRLIRLVLENSQQDLITLSEELKALELYIQLEEERMEHRFSSRVEVAVEVETERWCIPPLLVQPFVENAILHGLRHKTNKGGMLILRLKKDGIRLLIEVEDNGVGREAAEQINRQKRQFTQSMGIEVTGERIETLQALYGKNANFEIEDLYLQGQTGTRVKIDLPILEKA
ncbi:MAG: histidine kinase [Spirosomataceae bacterium]